MWYNLDQKLRTNIKETIIAFYRFVFNEWTRWNAFLNEQTFINGIFNKK